jgi:hypothetical protein
MLFCALASAAEIDSFTGRRALNDSGEFLDQVVNVWMEEAIIEANKPPLLLMFSTEPYQGCDEAKLMESLQDRFAGYLVGQLESFVNESTAVDSINTAFEDSIYRDFEFMESPTVSLTERLAVLLRIGDVYVGSDKLGHFFTEGYGYYERYVDESEQSALEHGELTESTFYGELTTGIFSYADLAANLNGLRFWNSILAKKPDPIQSTQTISPYIGCRDGKWHRLRPFHWGDYIDPLWDEALNCNAYRNDALLNKAKQRIVQVSNGKRCPLHRINEQQMEHKYGTLLPLIYNRQGARVLKSFNQKLEEYWDELRQVIVATHKNAGK